MSGETRDYPYPQSVAGAPPPGAYERAAETADWIGQRCGEPPQTAVVLGSGLDAFARRLEDALAFDYADLPHWPPAAVVGHPGRLVIGWLHGRRVAALAGRAHLYEGHHVTTVVGPVRAMGLLGVRELVLTNAAGGIATRLSRGALMIIDDHINLLGANPLAGPNDERFGPRFPDMTEVYSARLRALAQEAARAAGLEIAHGVYAAVPGPSYETPAEIRYLRAIGADAVGMSTVPEAIAARHMGLEVLGISCITNMAAGVLPEPIRHEEVLETTRRVRDQFVTLLAGIVQRLG